MLYSPFTFLAKHNLLASLNFYNTLTFIIVNAPIICLEPNVCVIFYYSLG